MKLYTTNVNKAGIGILRTEQGVIVVEVYKKAGCESYDYKVGDKGYGRSKADALDAWGELARVFNAELKKISVDFMKRNFKEYVHATAMKREARKQKKKIDDNKVSLFGDVKHTTTKEFSWKSNNTRPARNYRKTN